MFRRVKDLLGRKEIEEIQEISLDEIPQLLATNENAWEDEFSQSTVDARKEMIEIRDHMIRAVQALSKTEREAAFHPKLEKIAKNSIPQFEKALLSALNRQLPEDPYAFYQACSEILKGCVKGLTGPGRYLRNVLPEEMKEISLLVDAFGKEINNLTPRVAEWRKRKEGVGALRESLSRMKEMERTADELSRDIPVLGKEISDLNEELKRRTGEKESCERTLAEDSEYRNLMQEAADSEGQLLETDREMHSVTSTLSHVLRKAEKIAHHRASEKLSKQLNQVEILLSGGDLLSDEELPGAITAVLPVMVSMIGSGDIQLKNQEERSLFASPEKIPLILQDHLKRRADALEKAGEIKKRMALYPAIQTLTRIDAELKSLDATISDKERQLWDLKRKKEEILPGIPSQHSLMERQISAILGRKIRVISR